MIQHPLRSFALETKLDLVKGAAFFCHKPSLHLHVQDEYLESIQGKIGLENDGKEHVLSAGDGPMSIKPYVNHRLYPLSLAHQDDGETVVKFLLSGEKIDSVFELNPVFFENWYKYQDDVVVNGAKISLIQLFSTFDAGGTLISFPWWVPFGQTVSQTSGDVVGRWIGVMLGYQPFHRKWTTDWELVCQKMETYLFQRFADKTKAN